MDLEKVNFAKTSIEKSTDFTNDPLIEFVILWIGLNALYNDGEGRESEKFQRYIEANKGVINVLIKTHQERLSQLVDFINSTHQHQKINEFIRTRKSFLKPGADDCVSHFGELIYHVRNNMFHSEKPWNQADEAELLVILNPIVKDMLSKIVENYSN